MSKKNVLVTGTGGRSVGSGILHSLLRSSDDVSARWNVVAADADPFAWGIYVAEHGEVLPLARDADYMPSLLKIIDKYDIEAIVPGTEVETELLSNQQSNLPCKVICNRPELMPLMSNKFSLPEVFSKHDIKFIETFPISDWKNIVSEFGFPLILKPTTNTGGSKGLVLATTEEDIETAISTAPDPSAYCVQPYIGDHEHEYTVGVMCDKDGGLIDSIVMKRKLIGLSLLTSKKTENKTLAVSTGYSQGFIVKDERIQSFCENLAITLGSCGPLNIQLRPHGEDIYVFDFHPRFSGTTPMRADVGFNEVDILLRNYLDGESFGRIDYQHDVAAIRAFEHVIVPIDQMKS